MPTLTGVRRALLDLAKASSDGRDMLGAQRASGRSGAIRHTSEFADVEAAKTQFESLALELRAPDGSVVPTESIEVSDNDFTMSLARDDDDYLPPDPLFAATEEEKRLIASIEHDAALLEEWFGPDWDDDDIKPWEEQPSFPRYQIHVELLDDAAIP